MPTETTALTDGAQTPFEDLSGFQVEILMAAAIAGEDPPNGQDIKAVLTQRYSRKITHPRLYTNIDELYTSGYINKNQVDKRSNGITLTKYGELALEQLAEDLDVAAGEA